MFPFFPNLRIGFSISKLHILNVHNFNRLLKLNKTSFALGEITMINLSVIYIDSTFPHNQ